MPVEIKAGRGSTASLNNMLKRDDVPHTAHSEDTLGLALPNIQLVALFSNRNGNLTLNLGFPVLIPDMDQLYSTPSAITLLVHLLGILSTVSLAPEICLAVVPSDAIRFNAES